MPSLNGLSAIFLAAGFIFIRRKKITAHRNCMISAFCVSVIFLICYLTYHSYLAIVLHKGPTRFLNPFGFARFTSSFYSRTPSSPWSSCR